MAFLREEMLWGNDDPLFPATRIVLGPSRQFEAAGLERAHWSSAARIRTIFQDAFASAGLPYFNPHSFRNTLVRLGQSVCQTPEEFKAWSQNLGHDKVLTTFLSYGQVPSGWHFRANETPVNDIRSAAYGGQRRNPVVHLMAGKPSCLFRFNAGLLRDSRIFFGIGAD